MQHNISYAAGFEKNFDSIFLFEFCSSNSSNVVIVVIVQKLLSMNFRLLELLVNAPQSHPQCVCVILHSNNHCYY